MLTIFVVVYFKMHGNIRKGCIVIVVHKDMPGNSRGGKYHFGYEYTYLTLSFFSFFLVCYHTACVYMKIEKDGYCCVY